jgi:superfamily II DNA helicase RecQ
MHARVQEAGRAGRDGAPAQHILLYSPTTAGPVPR